MNWTRLCWCFLAIGVNARGQLPPPYVTAKDLLDSGSLLSASALKELFSPGNTALYMSVGTDLGWIKTLRSGSNGDLLVGHRDVREQWTYIRKGSWRINDDGKYCVDIPWDRTPEKWCRGVYQYGGALYLGNPERARDPSQKIGRLDVRPESPNLLLREEDWTGRWKVIFKSEDPLPIEGILDLGLKSGNWRPLSRIWEKYNFCLGRDFSVEIVERMDIAITFQIHASDVVRGCDDYRVTLMKIDANRLEGQIQNGTFGAIRMSR